MILDKAKDFMVVYNKPEFGGAIEKFIRFEDFSSAMNFANQTLDKYRVPVKVEDYNTGHTYLELLPENP